MTDENDLDFEERVHQFMSRIVAIAVALSAFFWAVTGAKIETFGLFAIFALFFIALFVWLPLGSWLIDKALTLAGVTERPPAKWWIRELAGALYGAGMVAWGSAVTSMALWARETLTR